MLQSLVTARTIATAFYVRLCTLTGRRCYAAVGCYAAKHDTKRGTAPSGTVVRGGVEARHLAALRRRAELVGMQEGVNARRHCAHVRVVDLQAT